MMKFSFGKNFFDRKKKEVVQALLQCKKICPFCEKVRFLLKYISFCPPQFILYYDHNASAFLKGKKGRSRGRGRERSERSKPLKSLLLDIKLQFPENSHLRSTQNF